MWPHPGAGRQRVGRLFAGIGPSPVVCACALVLSSIAGARAQPAGRVTFVDLDVDRCFEFVQSQRGDRVPLLSKGVVINDQARFDQLLQSGSLKEACSRGDLAALVPTVAFSESTVLALWVDEPCVFSGFSKDVLRDDGHKRVTYTVSGVASGKIACMGPGPHALNLIEIAKLPADYSITFKHLP